MPSIESRWRVLLTAIMSCAVVVVTSITLVRLQNQDRASSPGFRFVAERIGTIPDSVAGHVMDIDSFRVRCDAFVDAICAGELPVDSLRKFYQDYALWARDGSWDTTEVRSFTAYIRPK